MPSVARFCHHCSGSAASWFVIILQIGYMQSLISVVVERQLKDQPFQPGLIDREVTITMEDAPGTVFGGAKREVETDALNGIPLIGAVEPRTFNDQPVQLDFVDREITVEGAPGIVWGSTKRGMEDTSIGTSLIGVAERRQLDGEPYLVDGEMKGTQGFVPGGTKREMEDIPLGLTSDNKREVDFTLSGLPQASDNYKREVDDDALFESARNVPTSGAY